jgi:hypothetical protein
VAGVVLDFRREAVALAEGEAVQVVARDDR